MAKDYLRAWVRTVNSLLRRKGGKAKETTPDVYAKQEKMTE